LCAVLGLRPCAREVDDRLVDRTRLPRVRLGVERPADQDRDLVVEKIVVLLGAVEDVAPHFDLVHPKGLEP
jgi:hypothetical protein